MDFVQLLAVLLIVCVCVLLFDAMRRRFLGKRSKAEKFPEAWIGYLRRNVPQYRKLPAELKVELQKHIKAFVEEKEFEPCGDLEEVTEEMQVTIAAFACMLLLNKRRPYYSRLRSILVYPGDYWGGHPDDEYEDEIRSGESWSTGSVVLSWDAVKRSGRDVRDGVNVVIHEFAHQIDQADGVADGAPELEHGGNYRAWARVFAGHFDDLREKVARGEKTLLDAYGTTNPAEFFAVASETFFESPRLLERARPELYDQLRRFYRVDPARWGSSEAV